MADLDRETMFANEAFVIGMLQAVSGGSIVAALAQADVLRKYAGRLPFFLFITIVALSLIFSLLAAYWKHQYKMWDVKSSASGGEATYYRHIEKDKEKENELSEKAEARSKKANKYLKAMRRVIFLSVLCVLVGVSQLVAAFWYKEFRVVSTPNTALNPDAPNTGAPVS